MVLTGGTSTRMGRDKALIEIDGAPMAARVAHALRSAGATEVTAVGGDPVLLAAVGVEVWPDDHPGAGPLGAVLTALRRSAEPLLVAAACDLVAPDPDVFREIVEATDRTVDITVPVVNGVRQWQVASYRTRSLDSMARAFDAGVRSLRGAVRGLSVREVAVASSSAVADADRPQDLPPTTRR